MNFIPSLKGFFSRSKKAVKNAYDGAKMTRLNADWLTARSSADAEIGRALTTLIDRARDLERNNEYVVRYLNLIDNNVLGAGGVAVQSKATDPSGKLDDLANRVIIEGWQDWTRRDNCDVASKVCFREQESLFLRRAACEGNSLFRIWRGEQFGKWKFQLEAIEIDRLDLDYTTDLPNGNFIRFGIEFNRFGKVLFYHIRQKHPGDVFGSVSGIREKIPASEIIHGYWIERPGQSVGVPWFASVMQSLQDLGKFREAELVASRVAACTGYAIKQQNPDGWDGTKDADGNQLQEMSPGMGMLLSPGQELQMINPTHPNQVFGDFIKSALRGIAAGMGVSYNSLANDLESVNYSSMRAGKLEEVEEYKAIQSWMIENFHSRVFSEWLTSALSFQLLKLPGGGALPISKFDKFDSPSWKPRRWPWVDPQKDLDAAILSVEKGFKSRQQIIAEMGGDINEVFQEIEADEALAEKHGLEFPLGTNPQPQQQKPQSQPQN